MTEPLYKKELQYCVRCCMLETAEGIEFLQLLADQSLTPNVAKLAPIAV
jgi:hypothetical protein